MLIIHPFVLAMAEEEKQEEKKIPCSKELKFYKGVWDKRTIDGTVLLQYPVCVIMMEGSDLITGYPGGRSSPVTS